MQVNNVAYTPSPKTVQVTLYRVHCWNPERRAYTVTAARLGDDAHLVTTPQNWHREAERVERIGKRMATVVARGNLIDDDSRWHSIEVEGERMWVALPGS